jgi:hypothetical protein
MRGGREGGKEGEGEGRRRAIEMQQSKSEGRHGRTKEGEGGSWRSGRGKEGREEGGRACERKRREGKMRRGGREAKRVPSWRFGAADMGLRAGWSRGRGGAREGGKEGGREGGREGGGGRLMTAGKGVVNEAGKRKEKDKETGPKGKLPPCALESLYYSSYF